MKLAQVCGEVERFRASSLGYQQTFSTPLKDLHRFVATVLSQFRLETGTLAVELVVFEPENLLKLLARYSISPESVQAAHFMHVTITATGQEEIAELLEAALGDWVNFVFVPVPELFSIYADHDEYITFFANRESDLILVTTELVGRGFALIPDWMREF
jgi:hypothetical protein